MRLIYKLVLVLLVASLVVSVSPSYSATIETVLPIAIYNNNNFTLYNATFHIVLTPSNASFPIDVNTLYVTSDTGNPLYYTVDIPELDIIPYMAIEPGVIGNGYNVRYTTSNPGAGWYSQSYDDSVWNTGYTPIGNYTELYGGFMYKEVFDYGVRGFNLPRTKVNFTNLWVRFNLPGVPSGYTLYRAMLGFVYMNSTFELYVNGTLVANAYPSYNGTLIVSNATLANNIAIVDITKYVLSTPNTLVAIHINTSGLPSSVARIFDVWCTYELIPDYSNYVSIWVKVPEVPAHGYKVVFIHYGVGIPYNYQPYKDTSKVFDYLLTFSSTTLPFTLPADYKIEGSILVHDNPSSNTTVWIPCSHEYNTPLTIQGLFYTTESIPSGDIVFITTNQTSTSNIIVGYNITSPSWYIGILGGGITYMNQYNQVQTPMYSDTSDAVYLGNIFSATFMSDNITISSTDSKLKTNYTYSLNIPIHTSTYVGINIKGYGLIEYIAIYNGTTQNVIVTTKLPPNYVPPNPTIGGSYFNIYLINNTVYVLVSGLKAEKMNITLLRFGLYNSTFVKIVYTGQYAKDLNELVPLRVLVYGDNTTLLANITFNPYNSTSYINNTVSNTYLVNATGYKEVEIQVYTLSGQYVGEYIIKIPEVIPMTGYLSYLSFLIPIGLGIAFSLRGDVKLVGLGFIIYGIVILLLPYIGINIQHVMTLSSISIGIGVVILYVTRGSS